MKPATIIVAVVGVLVIAAGIFMIDVDQTQQTRLPEVTVEGGQMPAFDAEIGEIRITEDMVTVPNVDIIPPSDDS